jgi:Zn-dependent protease
MFSSPTWWLDKLYLLPGVLAGLVFHEFWHAYAAYLLGDPTAKHAGRLTFNPLKHLDVLGTALLIFFRFGWAKPVPFDPSNFKDPRKGILITSVAGPVSNLALALVLGLGVNLLVGRVIAAPAAFQSHWLKLLYLLLFNAFYINIVLALFNLIPLPPLDGSHVLWALLPPRAARTYGRFFDRYGRVVLIVVAVILVLGPDFGVPLFSWVIMPPLKGLIQLFSGHSLAELWYVYTALGGL